ncbi:MAG: hypothetical protein NTV81_02100, partial [Candidatus Komeilibacteria bacterium]|nr:hypothetical protein [Candidatus Komeilibacteria bacterium]
MKKIILIIVGYLILGFLMLKYYQYYTVTDVVPYLSIAQKYLQGDFINAINGVWGVLLSWLLMPFLLLPIKPLVAFKILNLLIGAMTIFGFWLLAKKFELNRIIETILLIALVPIILSFALVHTTPDLLVVTILIFYVNLGFKKDYYLSRWSAVYLGFWGAVGYLAKHYVFYFILIHLVVLHLFHFFYHRDWVAKKKIIQNCLISYAIFLVISGCWIFALSRKYQFFTISTSANYNRAWMAPASKGHAPEYLGLLPPPNQSANSMWEDLTYYVPLMPNYQWSPLSSWSNFIFQLKLILKNIGQTLVMFGKFTVLWPVVIGLAIWQLIKNYRRNRQGLWLDPSFLSLVVMILYSSGYLLIITSDRYLWINEILLLLTAGFLLSKLYNKYQSPRGRKGIIIIGLLLAFSALVVPIRRLVIDVNEGKNISEASVVLKNLGVSGK